jgi:lactoylglutathione lyase
MKYRHTTLHVADLEKSLQFYQEIVGLPLQVRIPAGPDTEIAFLGITGETAVELIAQKGATQAEHTKDFSLGFEVESIEAQIEFLKSKGIPMDSEVTSPNPKTRFFYILDPDGFRIQFVESR